MRERQVIRYFCSGCDKEYKSKSGCKSHEKLCWALPHTKACPTCRFSSVHEEEVPIEVADGVITGHKSDGYDCSHPSFVGHVGRHAREYNVSVGCSLHDALTIDDYPVGYEPLRLQGN